MRGEKSGSRSQAGQRDGSATAAFSRLPIGLFVRSVRLALYKSAAELTVRLLPRRHPLASLAGAEAKRTPYCHFDNSVLII